jgi:hypothetical protein
MLSNFSLQLFFRMPRVNFVLGNREKEFLTRVPQQQGYKQLILHTHIHTQMYMCLRVCQESFVPPKQQYIKRQGSGMCLGNFCSELL